jgi:amidase
MASSSPALHYLSIAELAALIRAGELSSAEMTRAQLARIASIDSAVHSYALVMADAALADAAAADAEIAAGRYRGPLHGIPIAVKDLCWTKGYSTAAGMAIHKDFRPNDDATVVRRLRDAGAVVLGKLQMTEGAYSDHHPSVRPPKNPWNGVYWPGISSSGSGAATAAGLCYGALGSDTGGSIRWPSAANGVTGLKPTWGRVSRYGVFELAASLDHVGTMARSAADAGLLLSAIAGSDPKDPTALHDPVPDDLARGAQGVRGLRIGVDAAWNSTDMDKETQAVLAEAVRTFVPLGAAIVQIAVPDPTQMIADWARNCAVEAGVAHEATYPRLKDKYGPVLASVIETGRSLSGMDYQRILLRRMEYRGRLEGLFQTVDLLLTPVQPFPPLTLAMISTLGEQPELIAKLQRYTCAFNMTGSPTITLPGGFTEAGMPIGFQLVAAHLREDLLVGAGKAFQSATDWHHRHPDGLT